jgi:hypothetical protein
MNMNAILSYSVFSAAMILLFIGIRALSFAIAAEFEIDQFTGVTLMSLISSTALFIWAIIDPTIDFSVFSESVFLIVLGVLLITEMFVISFTTKQATTLMFLIFVAETAVALTILGAGITALVMPYVV